MTHKALIRRLQISCLGLDPIDPLRLLVDDVIAALREHAMREVQRLGQEIEQEPVAYWKEHAQGLQRDYDSLLADFQAQRTWVGLTDDEIIDVLHPLVMADMSDEATDYEIARAIEAKLKQKNTHD
jgi:hypothetical protein